MYPIQLLHRVIAIGLAFVVASGLAAQRNDHIVVGLSTNLALFSQAEPNLRLRVHPPR